MKYSLLIFDLDDTLCRRYKTDFLSGRQAFFEQLPEGVNLAIATNQGGVGLRRWLELGGFGEPERYPTQAEVEERLTQVAAKIESWAGRQVAVYVCYRHQAQSGNWSTLPPEALDEQKRTRPEWTKAWRKPEPGMVLQALDDAEVPPEDVLFVGDNEDSDKGAAEAGGVAYQDCEAVFQPFKPTVTFTYRSDFVYGWLELEQRIGLNIISTLGRFEGKVGRDLQKWQDVGAVEFVRDDRPIPYGDPDFFERFIVEAPGLDVRPMYSQINDLNVNRSWLVYESAEAHVQAFAKVGYFLYRSQLVEVYGISQEEADRIVDEVFGDK